MKTNIAVAWKIAPPDGEIEIVNGELVGAEVVGGPCRIAGSQFSGLPPGPCRIELEIEAANLAAGACPTMVMMCTETNPFTFFLRDVRPDFPIVIPAFGVAVTDAADRRSFDEIEKAVREKGLRTNLQQIDAEPEESFENAAAKTREVHHPVWLGLSRDVRIFEVGLREPMLYTDWIRPRFHGHGYFWPEPEYTSCRYGFVAGRGWNCTENVTRRLDEGVLPILQVERRDDDILYNQTQFVVLEKTPLAPENLRGTHALVGDGLSVCHAFNDEQQKQFQALRDAELNREEETVLCSCIVAVNTGAVSRYAFFKAVFPHHTFGDPVAHKFDGEKGFAMQQDSDLVFGISTLNGKPMQQEEIAILLSPGEMATFEFFLPHRPIPRERAEALARRDVRECLEECRAFWRGKLELAARISVPEKRIDEMLRAGLVHLDLITYGHEPDGPLTVSDGAYGPVSAEVWLNIHYFDSMGWHDVARRALTYFLEKQHEDGFMQNFTGYMLDTGCVLFALGEHYRYTRDDDWVEQIASKVLKSCEFLLNWRARNLKEDLRGRGYGMMEGQVADPKDHERIFMLNAYACVGLARAAEMLEKTDPSQSRRLRAHAESFRADLRAAFFESLARGPVVPLGDGTWSPTSGPWAGSCGPKCLFTDGGNWWTHGSMTTRDDIIGPIHLASLGILDPGEQATGLMLDYLSELMFSRNVCASQPYYSQHPLLHLRRGEVKRFLKAYYNTMASMADREIYSFWEHFYHESPHKTHEEAEFLMQTRWMLYLEDGETLKLLQGVPRAWLENGKRIKLDRVGSHFGPLSLEVESQLDQGLIAAKIVCDPKRKPKRVEIRLPHPEEKTAVSVEGGTYDSDRETVLIEGVEGCAEIHLRFV